MNQNLGKLDRIFRFILGVWWLSPLTPQWGSGTNTFLAIIGWIFLIESLVGWCWLHRWFHIDNKNQ